MCCRGLGQRPLVSYDWTDGTVVKPRLKRSVNLRNVLERTMHKYFAFAGVGNRHFIDLQSLGPSELVNPYGFHGFTLTRVLL